jgi:preprotein translocase subunit SecF
MSDEVANADEPAVAVEPSGDGEAVTGRRHTLSDLYHERTRFQFVGHARRWALISGVMVVVSLVSLGVRGLNLGIDFEGGVVWQVPAGSAKPDIDEVRATLDDLGIADAEVSILSPTGASDEYQIRVQTELPEDPASEVRRLVATAADVPRSDVVFRGQGRAGTWTVRVDRDAGIDTDALAAGIDRLEGVNDPDVSVNGRNLVVEVAALPESPVSEVSAALADLAGSQTDDVSVDTVGPTWGERVTRRALQALVIFFVVIALYLTMRFEWKMAIAALIAVLHDIVITTGIYSVFQFRVSPATVTAFLTILGFSLYDTVVVYDKVRENAESLLAVGRETYGQMVNRSLNQVLMRSLSTSIVAVLPVISLLVVGAWVQGADALADFALALFFGLLVGSYSSIFVATPIVAVWKEREPKYVALRDRLEEQAARAAQKRRTEDEAAERATAREDRARREPVVASASTGPSRAATAPRGRRQRGRKRR